MNPEIEPMLEEAFATLEHCIPSVGRVEVEPDYESGLEAKDVAAVSGELQQLLRAAAVDSTAVATHDGQSLDLDNFSHLKRFVRRVSLHQAGIDDGSWIQVTPPGNWI